MSGGPQETGQGEAGPVQKAPLQKDNDVELHCMYRFALIGRNPIVLRGWAWKSAECPQCALCYPTVAKVQVNPAGPILENQTVTLTCNTPREAPSGLLYSWYKNHVLLEDPHSHALQLCSATRADTGFYFCEVQNAQGRERSGPVSVVVSRKWPGWGGTGFCQSQAKGWGAHWRVGVLSLRGLELTSQLCTPG